MSGGFADLGLIEELLRAVEDMGWILPTDVQDESIPLILGGGDMMGAAETGSGKTAAFALPIIQLVYERLKDSMTRKDVASINPADIHIQLNEDDRDQELILSTDKKTVSHQDPGNQWAGIRATHGVRSGQFYYEIIMKKPGNCRCGWSTMAAHLELGKDNQGFGYGAKGFKSYFGNYDRYGGEYHVNDVIGSFIDFQNKIIFFTKNGESLGKAYDIPEDLMGSVFFPTIALSNSEAEINFGDQPTTFHQYDRAFHFLQDANILSNNHHHLFDSNATEAYTISGKRVPLAIILEPTRDLAEQVYQQMIELLKYLKDPIIYPILLIGDQAHDRKAFKQQGVDLIVGTIGKISGMLQSQQLDLSHIRHFVLDEADKLMSSDNIDNIRKIFSKCPGGGTGYNRLQVIVIVHRTIVHCTTEVRSNKYNIILYILIHRSVSSQQHYIHQVYKN
jgi:ATP-dependent RNA helicase DDX1